MSKFSNTKLLLILVVLAAVIAMVKFMDSRKGERNFRNELVSIDTTKVSSVYIYPKSKKGQEVKLFSDDGDWKVRLSANKNQKVTPEKISGLFKSLTGIKPSRLAARTSDKWKEFEVDTSGTRVKVNEGDKKTLDIIIGKMNFSGGRNVETFVRLEGDDDTYAVNGYLEGTFNAGVDDWRDKTLIKGNKDAWAKLTFSLADTMQYQLANRDGIWTLDGFTANEQEVNSYLNAAASLRGNAFADEIDANTLGTPQYVLEIDDSLGNKIKVEGFVVGDKKVLRSSQNTDNIFSGIGVFDRVFVDRSKFVPVADSMAVQ